MRGKRNFGPREARERFLDRRCLEDTERTAQTYENRLIRFVEFCEENEIEFMCELSGWWAVVASELSAETAERAVHPQQFTIDYPRQH